MTIEFFLKQPPPQPGYMEELVRIYSNRTVLNVIYLIDNYYLNFESHSYLPQVTSQIVA